MSGPSLPLAFSLLALAIVSVWLPSVRVQRFTIPPWIIFFALAGTTAMFAGYLKTSGALALLITALCLHFIEHAPSTIGRALATAFAIPLCVLIAVHKIPGFANPILLNNVQFTPDAIPYTLFANFDKASIGLLLLALVCPVARTRTDWRMLMRNTPWIVAATVAIVILMSLAIGYIRFDPKLPAATWLFAIVNLLFVCVAEETFFRGFLQARLTTLLTKYNARAAPPAALTICAVLFGLAHGAGGLAYVFLATIAGIGYGYAYLRTQRIEASILTHFVVNLVHFVGFTYPMLAHQQQTSPALSF